MKLTNKNGIPSRTILLLSVLGFLLALNIYLYFIKTSDAYQTATKYIKMNEKIEKETGGVKGFGFIVLGSVDPTKGNSNLSFRVKGEKKDLYVKVQLLKSRYDTWKVEEINY